MHQIFSLKLLTALSPQEKEVNFSTHGLQTQRKSGKQQRTQGLIFTEGEIKWETSDEKKAHNTQVLRYIR